MPRSFEECAKDRAVAKDMRTLKDFTVIFCDGHHRRSPRGVVSTDAVRLGVYGKRPPVLCEQCAAHLAYGTCTVRKKLQAVLAERQVKRAIRKGQGRCISFLPMNCRARGRGMGSPFRPQWTARKLSVMASSGFASLGDRIAIHHARFRGPTMPVTKILIANRGDDDPSASERSEGAGAKRSGSGPCAGQWSNANERG